ncbi:hypothetical protein OX89_04075 [Diaphorobacter sp. J5-51]|nr:hypothetical protein OX89_04075 [Diaphorobacter sp. J5-51]
MRRFFNVLLQHAQRAGQTEIYRVEFSNVLGDAGYSGNNFDVAKDVLRSMAKTTVEWNIVNDRPNEKGVVKDWGVTTLLSHARIFQKSNRLVLEWSYSPVMRQEILDPKRYVPLSLRIYGSIKTGSAAALYEICMRYLTNVNGLTNKAEIEWWRPRITGVAMKDEAPMEYKYFKRDVLIPAIKEINEISDIEVELLEFKTGRKVSHLQFISRIKKQQSIELVTPIELVDQELMRRILALGVSDDLAKKIYVSHDEDSLRATLNYVEQRISKGGVESPVALFRDALKKGYGKSEGEKVAAVSKHTAAPSRAKEEDIAKEDPVAAAKRQAAQEYLDGLNPGQKRMLLDEFAGTISGIVAEHYAKSGLKSKIVRVELIRYVQKSIES